MQTDVVSKLKLGVDRIRFWKNANGNFEIWFETSKDSICLNFSANHIGVYNAKTNTGKITSLS